jgi:hypothetical protein
LLPLGAAIEGTQDRRLAQVVAVGGVTRQARRKAPQARQQHQDLLFEAFTLYGRSLSRIKRMASLVSSLLKAFFQES